MRYKVRAANDADFQTVAQIATANSQVFVVSNRRRTISTGDLSEHVKTALRNVGASIDIDAQFSADRFD